VLTSSGILGLKFFGAPKCHELLENLESREATGFLRVGVLQQAVLVSFLVKGFEFVSSVLIAPIRVLVHDLPPDEQHLAEDPVKPP
jgi:hypothetical protein